MQFPFDPTPINDLFETIGGQISSLSEADKQRFAQRWRDLEASGAQFIKMAEGPPVAAYPSDEFKAFLLEFGMAV